MTDQQRAAMQAALEFLTGPLWGDGSYMDGDVYQDAREVATQLRAALAEPEVERAEIGPEWTPCVKRPVTVHVRGQRPGEAHVSTREGLTPVKPDDLIMRGVDGEEYPIGRDLFNRTYSFKAALAEPEAAPKAKYSDIVSDGGMDPRNKFDHPPRREWQSLTDSEIVEVADGELDIWSFAHAVEAALKEKNA